MCDPSDPMKRIDLDARKWASPLDFYKALRVVLGVPDWHGHSPDAFLDSMIFHDEINTLRSPYTLKINGLDQAPKVVQEAVRTLANLLRKYGERDFGSDLHVEIKITRSNRFLPQQSSRWSDLRR